MRHEYAVHAGVYEDTWHDYETHKRRKIWRADVRGKRKEGFAWLQIRRLRKRFETKEEAREWAAQVKADWVRNNFFALIKY
ncbi:toxin PIN [Neisseria sp. HMSC064F03]|uniref:toxin PIN n=1 Tax=Neisseria sp. HMSC064F03 TaxID=1715037 RepID=UPI0008AA52C4|nr:toxin PIN [Neisseria sp. HMSC064F03]OHQ18009.1 toxin PIN [Neisseria sp. HMSC064F03]